MKTESVHVRHLEDHQERGKSKLEMVMTGALSPLSPFGSKKQSLHFPPLQHIILYPYKFPSNKSLQYNTSIHYMVQTLEYDMSRSVWLPYSISSRIAKASLFKIQGTMTHGSQLWGLSWKSKTLRKSPFTLFCKGKRSFSSDLARVVVIWTEQALASGETF